MSRIGFIVFCVVSLLGVRTVQGGRRHRRQRYCSPGYYPPMRQEEGSYGIETVEQLASRIAALNAFIASQPITPTIRAEIQRQLSFIGLPAVIQVTGDQFVDDDRAIPLLTEESVATVGGEVRDVRRSLRRLQGLPD